MPADEVGLSSDKLAVIAWEFLGSEFAGQNYRDWPIDRRLDAYLRHEDSHHIVNDAAVYDALLRQVMESIAEAVRVGQLPPLPTTPGR
jgi:hypothetical protein